MKTLDPSSLTHSSFGCVSRVGSSVRVTISPMSIYGHAFLGLLILSMMLSYSDLLDMCSVIKYGTMM